MHHLAQLHAQHHALVLHALLQCQAAQPHVLAVLAQAAALHAQSLAVDAETDAELILAATNAVKDALGGNSGKTRIAAIDLTNAVADVDADATMDATVAVDADATADALLHADVVVAVLLLAVADNDCIKAII